MPCPPLACSPLPGSRSRSLTPPSRPPLVPPLPHTHHPAGRRLVAAAGAGGRERRRHAAGGRARASRGVSGQTLVGRLRGRPPLEHGRHVGRSSPGQQTPGAGAVALRSTGGRGWGVPLATWHPPSRRDPDPVIRVAAMPAVIGDDGHRGLGASSRRGFTRVTSWVSLFFSPSPSSSLSSVSSRPRPVWSLYPALWLSPFLPQTAFPSSPRSPDLLLVLACPLPVPLPFLPFNPFLSPGLILRSLRVPPPASRPVLSSVQSPSVHCICIPPAPSKLGARPVPVPVPRSLQSRVLSRVSTRCVIAKKKKKR
jgi:hypothetical protein